MRDLQGTSLGQRIRFHRLACRKTQAVVAGLAGISEDYLSQVERGLKVPAVGTLQQIAEVLRVPIATLVGDEPTSASASFSTDVGAVRRAMTTPWLDRRSTTSPNVAQLAHWVDATWSRWQLSQTRYSDTTSILPGLVADVDAAITGRHGVDDAATRQMYAVAADLNFLLRSYCRRTGQLDLALLAADRGLRMAHEAGDPRRVAAARWNLCHALLANDEPASARSVALDAVQWLERRGSPSDRHDELALLGALHLVAAESNARCGESQSALRCLEEASTIAAIVGEQNVCWTAFGPTNVSIHAVNVQLHLGHVGAALSAGQGVDATRAASVERKLTFLLELAACYESRDEDGAVLDHLLRAERIASEDLRHNPVARGLVGGLMQRARRSSAPAVRQLATRIELTPA
jgi:transcriptional regulator with XRE-family HTH domain